MIYSERLVDADVVLHISVMFIVMYFNTMEDMHEIEIFCAFENSGL